MANVTLYYATNIPKLVFVYDGYVFSRTPVRFEVADDNSSFTSVYKGVNFQYDAYDRLIGGTMTGYNLFDYDFGSQLEVVITGISLSAKNVFSAVESDHVAAVRRAVFRGNDKVTGSGEDDVLAGYAGSDSLAAGGGDDTLVGGAGNDSLNGQSGNDRVIGGLGADDLSGGSGPDRFVFNNIAESPVGAGDTIWDFSRAALDRIGLATIDANAGVLGNQAFKFIGAAAFSNIAGQLRFSTENGSSTVEGDINGDGAADFEILVAGVANLLKADFVL